jgi:hypothetical protein
VEPASLGPSVLLEQIVFHWRDFPENWYLIIFRKSAYNVQVSVESDKNEVYFTWRLLYNYDYISLSFS